MTARQNKRPGPVPKVTSDESRVFRGAGACNDRAEPDRGVGECDRTVARIVVRVGLAIHSWPYPPTPA